MHAGGAVDTLEPLIQAARLLQVAKKTDADAQDLVQTCTALYNQQVAHCISPSSPTRHNFCVCRVTQTDGITFVLQIVKILTHYTPHGDLDERVTLNFIRTVQVL